MCGIAGIVSARDPLDKRDHDIRRMAATMLHRGPDSGDVWHSEEHPVSFAHRRLAIQDLSTFGSQPMLSHSGRYLITFNGEIYNFRSLRDVLEKKGCKFVGHSDTEVLLEAIDLFGLEEALKQCKGMFAFALLDIKLRKVYLARDRMGEKPLYYFYGDGKLLFASELHALKAHNDIKLEYCENALASYFRFGYISAPYSIFKNIWKVRPSEVLCFNLSSEGFLSEPVSMLIWDHKEKCVPHVDPALQNVETAVTELDSLLNRVISEQAIADVPLGAFLSGGIDSSVVSAILQSQSATPINTFTIGFRNESFNEAVFAKEISKHIGSNHSELYLSGSDVLDIVPKLVDIYDEPFADSSQIPMYIVSKLAREHVTVCLSGDGGDELFSGYNRYWQAEKQLRNMNRLPLIGRKMLAGLIKALSTNKYDQAYNLVNSLLGRKGGANTGVKLHKLADLMLLQDKSVAYKYLCSYWNAPEKLFNKQIAEPALEGVLDFNEDFVNAAMHWDQAWYIPGDNLVKTDRASMAVSLEMRLPLLDKDLVEFAWQLPLNMKIRDNKSKWLLREVLYKYVPKQMIERPKMGFSVPIGDWLKNELRDWAENLLSDDALAKTGLLNPSLIRSKYIEHLNGKKDHSNRLWTVLMFQAYVMKAGV